jgi:hypothetical protein
MAYVNAIGSILEVEKALLKTSRNISFNRI